MSVVDQVVGIVALLMFVAPWVWASVAWRRVVLPDWTGALARLAELVAVCAGLIVTATAVGAVGAFTRLGLALAGLVTGTVLALAARGREPHDTPRSERVPAQDRVSVALGVGVAAAAVGAHGLAIARQIRLGGIGEYDSLWYHLPVAAEFAQRGTIFGLIDVGALPITFYPFNGELLHGASMALLGHDLLSVAINAVWVAMTLLAGWCIGRPFDRAPLTMAATGLTLVMPLTLDYQAATANVDQMVVALSLAAAAFVVNAPTRLIAWALAAAALGMLMGTKVAAAPAVLAILGLGLFFVERGRRRSAAGIALAVMAVTGGAWYVRNLVRTDNPLPLVDVRLGPVHLPGVATEPIDCTTKTVAHWLGDTGALRDTMLPGIEWAHGPLWLLVVGVAVLVPLAVTVAGRSPMLRGVALAASAMWLGYLFTPASGGERSVGVPECFAYNQRFAAPALAFGLVSAMLVVPRSRRLAAMVALAVVFAVTIEAEGRLGLLSLALGVGAAALVLRRFHRSGPPPSRRRVATATAATTLVVVLAAVPITDAYLDRRYPSRHFEEPYFDAGRWATSVGGGARIATTGFTPRYPIYGPHQENEVGLVVDPDASTQFAPAITCDDWRRGLAAGRFTHVVISPEERDGAVPPQDDWTRSDPRATRVFSAGQLTAYELDAARPVTAC